MYHVGTAAEFTALHVMPGMEGPEGTLHSHDYRLDVVLDRAELDAAGMSSTTSSGPSAARTSS